jgi:hypothetical protein
MKNLIYFVTPLFLIVALSACGAVTTPPQTESGVSAVYTSVVGTLTAQATPATPIATPTQTATPTLTLQPSTTLPSTSPTIQFWNWPWQASTFSSCADSTFIKDVTIPEETTLSPGETFVKTWRFRNTGSCTWASDFLLVFVKGDDLDGSDTTIDETVSINKKVDLSLSLTAPDDEGTYVGYWKLADENGNTFGDLVYVSIVVVDEATSTPTATTTSTPTSSPTLPPTATSIYTPTYVPTGTSTSVPSSTATALPNQTVTPTPVPATETPTLADSSSATETATLVSSATPTVSPTTPTFTITPTDTESPLPTKIPTEASTKIPEDDSTDRPTLTPTPIQ